MHRWHRAHTLIEHDEGREIRWWWRRLPHLPFMAPSTFCMGWFVSSIQYSAVFCYFDSIWHFFVSPFPRSTCAHLLSLSRAWTTTMRTSLVISFFNRWSRLNGKHSSSTANVSYRERRSCTFNIAYSEFPSSSCTIIYSLTRSLRRSNPCWTMPFARSTVTITGPTSQSVTYCTVMYFKV